MTVAELLTSSRASHDAYRKLARKRTSNRQARAAFADIGGHLWDAYSLRQRAHDLDPEHTDPSWSEDVKASHADLMAFYGRFLS